MEGSDFDDLIRAFAVLRSRRALARLLVGLSLGGSLVIVAAGETGAKRKKGKKKRKKKGNPSTAPPAGPGPSIPPPPSGVRCSEGQTVCGGVCVVLNTDARNCGNCGKRCRINEVCISGECRCPVLESGTCDRGYTCCPAGNPTGAVCACSFDQHLVPATCGEVANCPAGSTPCSAPPQSSTCGITVTGPSHVCCPSGTTCDTNTGTCLL